MREIKFRAWDADRRKMIPLKELLENDRAMLSYVSSDDIVVGKGNIEFMQYTGLKDKNGKEIYEGDLVASKHSGNIGVVFWHDEKAMFMVDDSSTDKYVCPNDDWLDYEVIGNIKENKELLD